MEHADHVFELGDGLREFQTAFLQPVLTNHNAQVGVVPAAVFTEETKRIVTAIVGLHGAVISGVGLQPCIVGRSIFLNVGGQIPDDLVFQEHVGGIHEVALHDVRQGAGISQHGVGEGAAVSTGGREGPFNVDAQQLGQVGVERGFLPGGILFMRIQAVLGIPGDGLVAVERIGVTGGEQVSGKRRGCCKNHDQSQDESKDLFHRSGPPYKNVTVDRLPVWQLTWFHYRLLLINSHCKLNTCYCGFCTFFRQNAKIYPVSCKSMHD